MICVGGMTQDGDIKQKGVIVSVTFLQITTLKKNIWLLYCMINRMVRKSEKA